jgi:hypothetical protein
MCPVLKTIASILFVLGLCACGNKSTPPTEPAPTNEEAPTGEPAAAGTPTTAEECEAAGYQVVGDIGDGQVKCPDGTTEVSRIQYGIEGGVCCQAAEAPAAE